MDNRVKKEWQKELESVCVCVWSQSAQPVIQALGVYLWEQGHLA